MTKYEKISVLARETAKRISANREEWIRYLDVASRLYKYPFEDQILIYAQRPDATACASLEMWNEKMFCWVNRGAKGIALLDGESERPRLRYVFDAVSYTHLDVYKRQGGEVPSGKKLKEDMIKQIVRKKEVSEEELKHESFTSISEFYQQTFAHPDKDGVIDYYMTNFTGLEIDKPQQLSLIHIYHNDLQGEEASQSVDSV